MSYDPRYPNTPIPGWDVSRAYGGPGSWNAVQAAEARRRGYGTATAGAAGAPAAPVDPYVGQVEAELLAQSQADAAAKRQAINRAFIDLGFVPDFSQMPSLAGDLNATTAALAQDLTSQGLSVWGRLQHQAELNKRQMESGLAARGMLFSGETGYQTAEQARQLSGARYDAVKQVMDFLSQTGQTFMEREQGRRMQGLEARQQAAMRAQELAMRQAEMAQNMQIAQMQMAQNASMGGGGGGDMGGMQMPPEEPMGGGGAPFPSQQEIAAMQPWLTRKGSARPPEVRSLFSKYPGFFAQNPEFKPSGGSGSNIPTIGL